jgi:O-antigen/teichoic acid export membrane protein
VASILEGRVGSPVARNAAVLWVAQGVTLGLHGVWFALVSSRLGPTGLGIFVFAVAVPDLLGPFIDFGFKAMVAREVARDPAKESQLVPNLFYLRLLVALVCLGGTFVFLHLAGYHHATIRASEVASLIAVALTLQSFQVSLEVRLRMGAVAAANLAEALVLVGGVVVLSHRGSGLLSFVWLYVLANLLSLSVVVARAWSLSRYHWFPDPLPLRPVVRAALPLGATGVITGLYYRLDVFVLDRFHGASALGQFGAGYRFLDTASVFPGLLVALLNPVFARSVAVDRGLMQRRYSAAMHLGTVPSVMLAVGGTMTAWRALPALHAFRHYHAGGEVLAILSPAVGLVLLSSVLSGVLYNAQQQRVLLVVALALLGANATLGFALIGPFSYTGAALAITIGEGAATVALAWTTHRRLGITWPWKKTGRALAAGGLLAAALGAGYLLSPLAQLAVGIVITPAAVLVTGALSRSDLSLLAKGRSSASGPRPSSP